MRFNYRGDPVKRLILAIAGLLLAAGSSLAACPGTSLTFKDAALATQTLCFGGAAGQFIPQYQILDGVAGINSLAITAGNAAKVDGSAVTQPVSGTITANAGSGTMTVAGTVTANQGGTWTVQPGNTANTTAWLVTGTGGTFPVTGTVTANAGTNLNTSALALDASVTGLSVAQGSTTSGQKGSLGLGAVTTAAPTYVTGQTNPISIDTAGNQRVSLKDTPTNTNNLNVAVSAALPTGGNVIGAVTQSGGPWTSNLTQVGGGALALGQTTMSASVPVAIASNQTAFPVSQSGNFTSRIVGNAGGILDFVGQNIAQPANSLLTGCAFNTAPTTVTSGNATQIQCDSGGNTLVKVNVALPTGANTIGAVTQASGPWTSNLTQVGGSALALGQVAMAASVPVAIASNQTAMPVTQSGAWTNRIVGNTGAVMDAAGQNATAPANELIVGGQFNTTPTTITSGNVSPFQLDSSGNLLVNIKAGAAAGGTSSNFAAAFPSAGTAIGVKNGANMVNLAADGSSNLLINCAVGCAGGTFNNNADAVATSATNGQSAAWLYGFNGTTFDRLRVDGSKNLNVNLAANSFGTLTIGGTVTANAGTNLNTSALALDTSVNGILLSQGSTTSAQKGPIVQGAVTTSPPAYTTGQTSPLSLTTTGSLRVDGSGATQPVSGTVTANAGTGNFATNIAQVAGATVATAATGIMKVGLTDGSGTAINSTSNNLNVQCANCSGSGVSTGDEATFTAGTSLFAGSGGFFQTTATSNPLTTGQQGMFQVTANRALFSNLRNAAGTEVGTAAAPLQVSLANTATNATAVKVDGSAVTQPVSITGNQATNLAQVGGVAVALGQTTMASSIPVTIASNQSAVPASQSGTWTSRIVGNAGAILDFAGQNVAQPANSLLTGCAFNTAPTTVTTGNATQIQCDSAGNTLVKVNVALPTGANTIGAVTQAGGPWTVNQTQIAGTAVVTAGVAGTQANGGNQATNSNVSTNVFPELIAGSDYGGTPKIQNLKVDANGLAYVAPAPSALPGAAIAAVVSATTESGHILKASPGNLYSILVTTGGTAGFLMTFNSTTVPADGAVTPIDCVVAPANSTTGLNSAGAPPTSFSTGISVAFSSAATCFTKTASATAFFKGMIQ